jgi:hypothetical protein
MRKLSGTLHASAKSARSSAAVSAAVALCARQSTCGEPPGPHETTAAKPGSRAAPTRACVCAIASARAIRKGAAALRGCKSGHICAAEHLRCRASALQSICAAEHLRCRASALQSICAAEHLRCRASALQSAPIVARARAPQGTGPHLPAGQSPAVQRRSGSAGACAAAPARRRMRPRPPRAPLPRLPPRSGARISVRWGRRRWMPHSCDGRRQTHLHAPRLRHQALPPCHPPRARASLRRRPRRSSLSLCRGLPRSASACRGALRAEGVARWRCGDLRGPGAAAAPARDRRTPVTLPADEQSSFSGSPPAHPAGSFPNRSWGRNRSITSASRSRRHSERRKREEEHPER